ncbi:hypothetical protein J2T55_002407 [Methylohalomonas lacus]|uniref:Uncharacterized protein n=1 Tax=Methylohalomonas lacus TaxID=398773 RepID=A0AAE3HL77_9GAMM|nr:hypothetical protein [Methylohalomonas lacus]
MVRIVDTDDLYSSLLLTQICNLSEFWVTTQHKTYEIQHSAPP